MSKQGSNTRPAKRGLEITGRSRAVLLRALDILAEETNDKDTPAQILAKAFKINPIKFMDTMSKYIPKNIDITTSYTTKAQNLTDDELRDIIAERARERRTLEGELVDVIDFKEETG